MAHSPPVSPSVFAGLSDDLQVVIHDGGPRLTQRHPELVWVRMDGSDGDVFFGRVMNQPTQLQTVRYSERIRFIVPASSEHPVMVTEKYLRERPRWKIHPCEKCGFSELFDAPSDLIRVAFPNMPADAEPEMFTAFCPLCRGVQGVELKESGAAS